MIRNLIPISPHLAIKAIGEDAYRDYGGWMLSSRSWNLKRIPEASVWAADNDCFSDWQPKRFTRFLKRIEGLSGCLFVNAPDVVGDAAATLARFEEWQPVIAAHNLPVGFVLQNGITIDTVPWDRISAVFIGGDTLFKFSKLVHEIAQEARRGGYHVHMGRANSGVRIRHSAAIGCHSFDGTSYKWSKNIRHDLQYQKQPVQTHIQRSFAWL